MGGFRIPRCADLSPIVCQLASRASGADMMRFFARLLPTPVATPRLVKLNENLARHLGLDAGKFATPAGVEILVGNRVPKSGEPLAMAYAGHPFGAFVQLRDGRAILLSEVIDRNGVRCDIQLKGSGPTAGERCYGRAGCG
jgi:serine/tyrosine/threonine adenylyltransferase